MCDGSGTFYLPALAMALSNGPTEVVKLLADVTTEIDEQDKFGRTALSLAVGATMLDVVPLLLKAGANVNAKDKTGNTVLCQAIRVATSGSWMAVPPTETEIQMLRLLLDADAEVDDVAIAFAEQPLKTWDEARKAKSPMQAWSLCNPGTPPPMKVAMADFGLGPKITVPSKETADKAKLEFEELAQLVKCSPKKVWNLKVQENSPSSWKVDVHNINGVCVATIELDPLSTTLEQLQAKVAEQAGCRASLQRFVHKEKVLDADGQSMLATLLAP